jgi:transposase-like protein
VACAENAVAGLAVKLSSSVSTNETEKFTPRLCRTPPRKRCKTSSAGVSLDSVIHSDGWRGYNGLVDAGYSKPFRVNHSDDVFAIGNVHINGIEGFWSYAKRRLQKFNGVPTMTFYLHLKECEYRFNHRDKNLQLLLLKLLERFSL